MPVPRHEWRGYLPKTELRELALASEQKIPDCGIGFEPDGDVVGAAGFVERSGACVGLGAVSAEACQRFAAVNAEA